MTDPTDPTPDAAAAPPHERVVSVTRHVAASPEQIFDLLANPTKHHLIDGSGSVRGTTASAPERLSLGSRFSMSMRIGMPYRITNEVVEFEEGRLIAWRHYGGHVWRYRLVPSGDGTDVTEEFDWRTSRAPALLKLINAPTRNRESIEATLDRLAAHFAG